MAKLVFTDKNFSGRVYELVLEKTTVGRGEHNTLVIHDKSLSASHCEILMHGSEIIVRDLDSLNGTFVDGSRLNKQAQAKSGQAIRFGSVEACLELDPAETESDTGEITAVYTLGKIMRERERTENLPKPATASMQLDPATPPATGEQTILLPGVARPVTAHGVSGNPAPSAQAQPKRSVPVLAILAALALLAMLVWYIWGRK